MKLWGQPAKDRSEGISIRISSNGNNREETFDLDYENFLIAEETAWRTRELLATRGWCLWQCSILSGEVIALVRGENMAGMPKGYPIYTETEMEELCQGDVRPETLRLVHEAKKLAGAKVIS